MRGPRSRDAPDPGCAFLSVILLAGLGLNAWLGWRLADPLAALAMVPLIAKEGIEARRGETCCAC
jgi:divalent metal cation (Fe/Co/Zn/Cd) transporter